MVKILVVKTEYIPDLKVYDFDIKAMYKKVPQSCDVLDLSSSYLKPGEERKVTLSRPFCLVNADEIHFAAKGQTPSQPPKSDNQIEQNK